MVPSLLYPTSTSTSPPLTSTIVPRTTSPSSRSWSPCREGPSSSSRPPPALPPIPIALGAFPSSGDAGVGGSAAAWALGRGSGSCVPCVIPAFLRSLKWTRGDALRGRLCRWVVERRRAELVSEPHLVAKAADGRHDLVADRLIAGLAPRAAEAEGRPVGDRDAGEPREPSPSREHAPGPGAEHGHRRRARQRGEHPRSGVGAA